MATPVVSVVIPTVRRAGLVTRAVKSVLAQTMGDLEVIVVIDGPDPATANALAEIEDERLVIEQLEHSVRGGPARNRGVALARAEWVAFLDDDDEWLPEKLERQLDGANVNDDVLVICLSHVITQITTYVWPRIIYNNRQPMGDYLFRRRSFTLGEAHLQTSTWLLPRRLMQAVPFRDISRHQDWDVVLRLFARPGMKMHTVPEILVRHYVEDARQSVGRSGDWRTSLAWLDSMRPMVGRRGYSGFCATVLAQKIAIDNDRRSIPVILRKAVLHGRPTLTQTLVFASIICLPPTLRRRSRALLKRAGLA